MSDNNHLKEEVLERAERVLYYNNLLIEQCDGWLSAEEGNRNMEKRIREQKTKIFKMNKIAKIFLRNIKKKKICENL